MGINPPTPGDAIHQDIRRFNARERQILKLALVNLELCDTHIGPKLMSVGLVSAAKYSDAFGVSLESALTDLRDICETFIFRVLVYRDERQAEVTQFWIDEYRNDCAWNRIELYWHRELRHHLVLLQETNYRLEPGPVECNLENSELRDRPLEDHPSYCVLSALIEPDESVIQDNHAYIKLYRRRDF